MNPDDLLYGKIHEHLRIVNEKLNDNTEVTSTVTTKDGIETWTVTKVTVSSGGPPPTIIVIVDDIIIAQPPPVYNDDCCYD